ncbi:MAG: Malonyl-(acyl-carrier protein) O-methyltransferase [Parcubacteria group bacterium ADurb.Bin326]|nr:MAG: Malonyl-(acyl-carrier protein) O-methyltransferase [Parcubacteria group bacterium ADurb.Bin326]
MKKESKEFFYEDIANDFEKIMNSYEVDKRKKLVFSNLIEDSIRGKTLLDVGCGIGLFSAIAEKKGAKVTSLDMGKALLTQVSKRCNSKTVVGSVTRLPFKDDSFDIVLATEVIEHSSNPAKGFAELVRVAKPGGKVVITVPNRIWIGSLFVANFLRLRPYQGLENWQKWSTIKRLSKKNKLVIEKMFGFNIVPVFYFPFNGFNTFMDRFGKILGPIMVNIALVGVKKRF